MSGSSSIVNDPEAQTELAWDIGNCQVWASTAFKTKAEMDAFCDESKEKRQEFKRQNVIYELANAERTFVKNLLILKHVYQEPLLKIITQDVCDRIFPNIPELLELSRTFKNDLLKLVDPETLMYPDVSGVIAKFLDQPNLSSEFTKFCANGNGPFFKEQMKNEKFAEVVYACEKDSSKNYGQRSDLKSLLTCVFQKATRILMLVEPVHKYTPEGTAESDNLTECLTKGKAFIKFVNDAVGAENDGRVEKSARGWLITRRKSMSLKPGDCRMNYSATLGDTNMAVNLVLYDQHLVLFPSDTFIMYNAEEAKTKGKSKAKSDVNVNVHSIGFEDNNVYVTKSEDPCKFFIVSTNRHSPQPEPKVYTIVCEPVQESDPEKKLIKINEAKDKCEMIFRELSQACRAHTVTHLEEDASAKSVADLDTEILALLTAKLDIMVGQNMPLQDFTQSITQLTIDTENLHKTALELLGSYTGDDKAGKSASVSASYESVLTNIGGVTSGYQSGGSQKKEPGFFKKVRQSISTNPKKDKQPPKEKLDKMQIGKPALQDTTSNQVGGAMRELQNVDENLSDNV